MNPVEDGDPAMRGCVDLPFLNISPDHGVSPMLVYCIKMPNKGGIGLLRSRLQRPGHSANTQTG